MVYNKLGVVICITIILLCSSCNSVLRGTKTEEVISILGAFEQEIVILEDKLTEGKVHKIEGIRFVSGRLGGKKVALAWAGIGKVNTAMTTTLMIEHFQPSRVIFTGVAGGINPELSPGDIVVAEKIAYHDMGMLTSEGLLYQGVKSRLDNIENPVFFPADEQLLKLAEQAAAQVKLGILRTSKGERTPKIVKGVIVTGDTFIASKEKCEELRNKLKADAVEMEGAAVAQLCYQRQIPFVVIRCISDKADEAAKEDLATFYVMAAENSSSLVAEMVALSGSQQIQTENVKNQR